MLLRQLLLLGLASASASVSIQARDAGVVGVGGSTAAAGAEDVVRMGGGRSTGVAGAEDVAPRSPPPPPTPTGSGGQCPFFSSAPGAAAASGSPVCPAPAALRRWQSLKFGLFLHWGAYSQIGFDASWSLNWKTLCAFGNPTLCAPKNCSECTHADMTKFREMYWGLSKTFNPKKFDPTVWASAAKAAGMKYFVMTTKHHDGFAMYNTSAHGAPGQPVYGVTGPDCPAQRDLFGEVVEAMRAEELMVGACASLIPPACLASACFLATHTAAPPRLQQGGLALALLLGPGHLVPVRPQHQLRHHHERLQVGRLRRLRQGAV